MQNRLFSAVCLNIISTKLGIPTQILIICMAYRKLFSILGKLNKRFLDFVNYMAGYGKAVEQGYRSNALAPLVWLDIFALPILLTGVFFIKIVIIKYILIGIIFILLLFTLIMYVVLFKKDPKLLQSEKYRLEDKRLDLIAQKGSDSPINPDQLPSTTHIGTNLLDE